MGAYDRPMILKQALRVAIRPFASYRKIARLETRVTMLEQELKQATDELTVFRKQAFGLREWIRVAHRLEHVPLKGTIQDILRKPNQ